MRNLTCLFVLMVFVTVPSWQLRAEELSSQDTELNEEGMQKRITVDAKNAEIVSVLKDLSEKGGFNIVVTNQVSGICTVHLKDVTVKKALDLIILNNELAYVREDNIYNVMAAKEYDDRYGRSFGDTRKLKVFRLRYAIPEKAFTLIDALKSKIGKIIVDQNSGTVAIMDAPETLEEMEKALAVLEQKNEVAVFHLKHAKAKDIREVLAKMLDDRKMGSTIPYENGNMVVVETMPDRLDEIRQVVSELDKKIATE